MPTNANKKTGTAKNAGNTKKEASIFGNTPESPIGKVIGKFEIRELLGESSIATLYGALDKQTRKNVTLKVVHKNLLPTIRNQKKLEQKLRQVFAVEDPHVFSYRDVLFADGRMVLVASSQEFESLEDLLSKTGHIGPERAIGIFINVARALEACHKRDIVHRDLKPSNILIVDDVQYQDQVKVSDFSIAKLIADETSDGRPDQYMTRGRETFVSPLYLSPEQCSGKKVDARSDIYSLGCVMYEALTGKPPFVGKNVLETAYKHMNDSPRPLGLDTALEPMSTRLEEVVAKCLAKEPELRFQSPDELRHDLELISTASENEWTNAAYVYRQSTRVKRKRRRGAGGFPLESAIWISGVVLLVSLVIYWTVNILKPESKRYPNFDTDKIWLVAVSQKPQPVEDFGNKEEAAKVNLSSIQRDIGTDCREYADAILALVQLYHDSHHWADALTYSKKLVKVTEQLEKEGQEGPGQLSECYRLVAYAAFNNGTLDEAADAAEKSLSLAVGNQALNNKNIQCLRILGDIYSRKNNLPKASDAYFRLLSLTETEREHAPALYCDASAKVGDISRRMGRMEDAQRYYKQAIDWWRSHGATESPWAPRALFGYSMVLYAQGHYKESEENLKEAMSLAKKASQGDRALQGAIRKLYIDTLYKTNWVNALSVQLGDAD